MVALSAPNRRLASQRSTQIVVPWPTDASALASHALAGDNPNVSEISCAWLLKGFVFCDIMATAS
jgi:hypothetical protein